MNIKQLLIDTLSIYNYPIILQGSMSDDDMYPDDFFTFFNNATDDRVFFDNEHTVTIWDFDLNFYSNNPERVDTMLTDAKMLLKRAGFIVNGKGYDVLSDEPSHTGRGINLIYIERGANL